MLRMSVKNQNITIFIISRTFKRLHSIASTIRLFRIRYGEPVPWSCDRSNKKSVNEWHWYTTIDSGRGLLLIIDVIWIPYVLISRRRACVVASNCNKWSRKTYLCSLMYCKRNVNILSINVLGAASYFVA